jgi:hypothetical protein
MDNLEVSEHRSRISRGISVSAVSLVLLSSSVVIISFVLLANYIIGISDSQFKLEEFVQAALTEESALSGLEMDIRNNRISDLADLPVYRIGDLRTSFQMIGTSTIPPEELSWQSRGSRILSAIPAGNSIFVISESKHGLKIDLLTGSDFENTDEISCIPEWDLKPFSSAAVIYGGNPLLFIVSRGEEMENVTVISPETGSESYDIDLPIWNESSLLSAGCYLGNPALLISDGTNRAQLFLPGSFSLLTVSSIPGTTPVFYGQDQLFGEMGKNYPEDGQYPVNDAVYDDFDGNGTDDLVFIGSGSMYFVSEATGMFLLDTVPCGTLVAWGSTGTDRVLSAKWIVDGSYERWRTITEDGFAYSSGPEFFPFSWEGRLAYSKNSMIGSVDELFVIADDNTGQSRAICESQSAVFCNLDGEGLDLVYSDNDLLRILMNPLEGNGFKITLKSVTYNDEDVLIENMWDLMIYGAGPNRRVHSERTS